MSFIGMIIWHWYVLKTGLPEVNTSKQSPAIFLKHNFSKRTGVKCCVYRFKAQPALERGRGPERQISNKCIQFKFSDRDLKFGMGVLWNLILVAIFGRRAYIFSKQCKSCLNIGDIHLFHFKMYISAVFCLIAINRSPYSPTVTWYICAELTAFISSGTKSVGVRLFGQVVAIALCLNDLTIWVAP